MAEVKVDVVYGIDYIGFAPRPATGIFPAVGAADLKLISHIVMQSYTPNKEDDQSTDINCEDFDEVFLSLTGEKGKSTKTFRSYNYSDEAYAFFLGYKVETDGSLTKIPGYVIPELYMEVKTRQIQSYPAKIYQYMPIQLKVSETGTLGKDGLMELEFEATILANTGADGKEIGNEKITRTAVAARTASEPEPKTK